MNNKKKHKILEVLDKFYEDKSLEAMNYTNLGKSMSLEQLHRETNINISDLKAFCKSLESANLINLIHDSHNPSVVRYYINDSGISRLKEKYFLNLLWYRDYRISIPVLVSSAINIIGILISVWLSTTNTDLQERIQKLEQKTNQLQLKIDSLRQSPIKSKERVQKLL